MNEALLNRLERRKLLYNQLKRSPYNQSLRSYFTRFKNKLTIDLDERKNRYYAELFHNCGGRPAEQWRLINSLLGNKKQPI
ncbi:hypothetical protein J6590_099740, partial [Homalodisca vitripennis]